MISNVHQPPVPTKLPAPLASDQFQEKPKFDRGALVKALAALIVADLTRAPGTIDS